MRLSLGQDLRMVQKQVLAPRMIQSMEILQLPILALQERIEQEIEENPVLDLQEDDPDLPAETAEAEARGLDPDAPTEEERELVIDETTQQRGRLRAADEDGRGVARPLRGTLPSLAGRGGRGRRAEARRHGQHDRPAAVAAGLPPRPVGLVRARAGLAGDVRADHLQPRHQRLSARPPGRPAGAGRDARKISPWPSGPWPWCRSSTRPAWPPATCANACCCNSRRACPVTSSCRR